MKNTEKYQGGFWPSEEDTLLLKAILLPRREAIKAWEEWLQIVNIDTIDAGVQRMFPLLYIKLKEYNIDHPLMDRFKGLYRQTWYKNQMTFHHIAPLLKGFKDAGIDVIVLKGAALTVLYYNDLGLRPMSDFDLMVSPADVKKASIILQKMGYELKGGAGVFGLDKDEFLYITHSIGLRNIDTKQYLDLHWHMIRENCGLYDDDPLWHHKQPISINDSDAFTLDATDHLIHTCAHGLRWNPLAPIRWVADAKTIIDESKIDWERLILEIQKRKIVLPVWKALGYLYDEFSIPIPLEVLTKLSTLEVEKIEKYGDKVNKMNWLDKPFTTFIYQFIYSCLLFSQARYNSYKLCQKKPWMVFEYLKSRWGLASGYQVPIDALKRIIRRVKR